MKINNIQDIKRPDGTVVFVTGCTGQDGSLMIDYLLKETDVSIVGGARRLSVENHVNINHLQNESRFQLVNFDLTDSHSIYKIIEHVKPDYFINLAAQSFVASSWDFAKQTWETNSTAVLDCLEAIRTIHPICRFYNAGSSEEFGNVAYEPQDENHPSRPRSPYGASKAAARTIVKVYRESYGLYAVQGWLFNHESQRRGLQFISRKITNGVANIFESIVNNKPITSLEFGNLNSLRDWSHAEDMVDAVWKMLNQEKYNLELGQNTYEEWYELYNIYENKLQMTKWFSENIKDYVVGSGEKHSIREFVEKSFELLGISGEWSGEGLNEVFLYKSGLKSQYLNNETILVKVNPKFYRPAEVDVLLANPSKIKEELAWEPKNTFDDLIEVMVTNDLNLLDFNTNYIQF